MITFQLKTYNEKKEETKPHFYILCKGLNSGKPLEKPCPNCFCCVCENEEANKKSIGYPTDFGKVAAPFCKSSEEPQFHLSPSKTAKLFCVKRSKKQP